MRKADKKVIQQIFPPENTACLPQDQQFIIEDINFDGLNDIRLVRFIPAAPNIPYYFWVFDNATGRFKRTKLFEDITTPEFDHRKKLIFSSWRAGWDDRGASTYKIIAGKPVLIEEYEIKDMEGDTTKRIATQKKRINGKLRLVKRTIENIDEDK